MADGPRGWCVVVWAGSEWDPDRLHCMYLGWGGCIFQRSPRGSLVQSGLASICEAAHRILEGLGPQVELVSWGTGWGALGSGG